MLEMRDTQTPHTGNRQLVRRRRFYYSTGAQLLGPDTTYYTPRHWQGIGPDTGDAVLLTIHQGRTQDEPWVLLYSSWGLG